MTTWLDLLPGRAWCVAFVGAWLAGGGAVLAKEAPAAVPVPPPLPIPDPEMPEEMLYSDMMFAPDLQKNKSFKEFTKWAKQDAKAMPGKNTVLAIGSSGMAKWHSIKKDLAPAKVVPRGFSGSTMGQVLLMLSFFQRYPSDTVLIDEGDNDLAGGMSPDMIVEQAKAVVAGLREANPDVKIYFLSVKPSVRRANLMAPMAEANAKMKAMCDADEKLEFVDVYTPMLNAEGQPKPELFVEDKLQMTPAGYEIWTQAVRKKLKL